MAGCRRRSRSTTRRDRRCRPSVRFAALPLNWFPERFSLSHYCILNEAGEVVWVAKLLATPKGIEEVFSKIPHGVAPETGTHSPWMSRQC
jgi:hypothetical protein